MKPSQVNKLTFQKGDEIEILVENDEDFKKLNKLNSKYDGRVIDKLENLKNHKFVLSQDFEINETPKTKTKYLKMIGESAGGHRFYFLAQIRYLKIIKRLSRHPLTRMFVADLPK